MHKEIRIVRWKGNQEEERADAVALEAPLEILLDGESLAVTMRTPGDDFALAAGFLFAEGVIQSSRDIGAMGYVGQASDPDWQNLLNISLKPGREVRTLPGSLNRNFIASSSCGVCGKASLDAARCTALPVKDSPLRASASVLQSLDSQMRAEQQGFGRTGGLHAAALFDPTGSLLALAEDVGRHNAVDKIVGRQVLGGAATLEDRLLMVSGRASFEILQKAAVARLPIVCAVSAPSSLAVDLARELNITLVGFLRGDTMNVYSAPHRVIA